jgi:hypothetical protein
MKGFLGAAAAIVILAASSTPVHAWTVVLPRAGQVGVGLQYQYGGLAQAGNLGDEFGTGSGIAFRIVYRTRYERAIGLSYDTRQLKTRTARFDQTEFLASEDGLPRSSLTLQTYGLDGYQFFGTRTRTQAYLSASGGLAKTYAKISNGDPVYPIDGDGLFLGAGFGLERFIYRSWAANASVRYTSVFLGGQTNHDVQAAVGMIFYAAY